MTEKPSSDLTEACLTPEELEEYGLSGDLPIQKLSHIEQCPACDDLLGMAKELPDVSFILSALNGPGIGERPDGNRSNGHRGGWRLRGVHLAMAALLIVGLAASTAYLWSSRNSMRSSLEDLWASLVAAESRVADLEALNESLRPVSEWSEERIEKWFSSPGAASPSQMTELYALAELKRFKPAICKAAITGAADPWRSGGEPRAYVIAARNMVRSFSWSEVEAAIREFAPRFHEEEAYIISNIRKAINE